MRRSKLPSRNTILFNGAAIAIGAVSLVFALKSSLFKEAAENCSARYNHGTRMTFEKNGKPLSPDDLQSRLAGTDWGLIDRAKVVKIKSGPADLAIQVDLTGAKADDKIDDNGKEGVGFTWIPRSLGAVDAACLSYGLYLPETFDFGAGGRLPGLMGVRTAGESKDSAKSEGGGESVLSMRMIWRDTGLGDVFAQLPSSPDGRQFGSSSSSFQFSRAQWVNVEQEVILNTGENKNGILRVWLDGTLGFERTDLDFRGEGEFAKLTGVMAELVPTGKGFPVTAKDQKILMTPFEVRWHKAQ